MQNKLDCLTMILFCSIKIPINVTMLVARDMIGMKNKCSIL